MTLHWEWDMEAVIEETKATDNVVELIVQNFHQKLSQEIKELLKMASCIGAHFDASLIWSVLQNSKKEKKSSIKEDIIDGREMPEQPALVEVPKKDDVIQFSVSSFEELIQMLETAVADGTIERTRKQHVYKFVHDRFQQAAYSLLDGDPVKRGDLHYRIGHVLLLESGGKKDRKTFMAVDQLNKGSAGIVEESSRLRLARLNLAAGEISCKVSAYVPAMEYFVYGIMLLPDRDRWQKDYQLCLDLYSSAAEVAYVNGDFKGCKSWCTEIDKYAKDDEDKLRSLVAKVDSLGAQQRLVESIELSFHVMRTILGEKFPKRMNMLHVVSNLVKCEKMLKGKSDREILSMPLMKDKSKLVAMKLLIAITQRAYFAQKPVFLAISLLRMVQLTMEFGLAKLSPSGLASYGLIMCSVKGNIKEAYRYGRLAMTMVDQIKAFEWKAQVVCVASQFLFHWQDPCHNLFNPLLEAHHLGQERGDIEYSLMSAGGYCLAYLYSGLKLTPLLKDVKGFSLQMKESGQMTSYYATIPVWQLVQNLVEESNNPMELTGDAMNEEGISNVASEANNMTCLQNMWFFQAMLAYYFGDLSRAQKCATKFRKSSADVQAHITYPNFVFFSGLIHLGLAKNKKKWKYFMGARRDIKMLKKWVAGGAVNSYHRLLILKAQYNSLKKGRKMTMEAIRGDFGKAIQVASRMGFLGDTAVAYQLLGEFFLNEGMQDLAAACLESARLKYFEWEAFAVADHLSRQYAMELQLITRSEAINTGGSLMARTRHKKKSARNLLAGCSEEMILEESQSSVDGPGARPGSMIQRDFSNALNALQEDIGQLQ